MTWLLIPLGLSMALNVWLFRLVLKCAHTIEDAHAGLDRLRSIMRGPALGSARGEVDAPASGARLPMT